ncbi:MAG: porin [Pseudomonadota bacterium]
MKKSLIALAALAAVSAASAQSSVTLYGVLDIGYGSQTTEMRATATGTNSLRSRGVMDGANAGNRIGFRGTEDLGGGLKANFVVEQGINPTGGGLFAGRAATGAQQNAYPAAFTNNLGAVGAAPAASSISASTNRQTYIGLSGATWGTVNIGYQYNNLYELSTLSGYNIGSEGVPGAYSSHVFGNTYLGGTRSNGLTYISPNFGGFTVRVQYGAAGATSETNNVTTAAGVFTPTEGRRYSLMGQYANGPLSAALAYTSNRVNTAALGASRTGNLTQLGASYDFGVVKLAGTYNTGRDGGIGAANFGAAAGTSTAYRAYQLGLSAPFGALVPYITYGRAYATTDGVGARAIDIKQAQIGARYSLSKRTTAYAFYGTTTDNAAQSTVAALVAPTAASIYRDKKTVIGVQHSF